MHCYERRHLAFAARLENVSEELPKHTLASVKSIQSPTLSARPGRPRFKYTFTELTNKLCILNHHVEQSRIASYSHRKSHSA